MDDLASNATSARRRRRRPQKQRRVNAWDSIGEGLLVTVVVASVLAVGSVHVPVLLAVSALALAGAAIEAVAPRRVPRPAMLLAVLGLYSAFQAMPLPAAWVRRATPVSADIWLRCLTPFGEPPLRTFSLSLDPSASVADALKWLTYASVYVMATRVRARRGSVWLTLLLFGSAVLVALITLIHGLANVAVLYGVYHPDFTAGRWNVGPLLNSNNLAGYAILGLFAGGGLLLSSRAPLPRLPVIIGLAVVFTAICLSGSRAGVLSVIVGGALVLVWQAKGRRMRFSLRNLVLGMAPLLIGLVLAIVLGTANDAGQLASLDARRKVSVWLWSLPMIRDHVFFGVGRGAFETAFPPYRQALAYDWAIVVTHAENFVVQWIAEWGIPVGVCAVVLIVGYVLREWQASQSDRLRFMVMTGVVALLVQNLADLGLEVPGLAIAAVLALAAGERTAISPAVESQKRFAGLAIVVAASACWVAALVWSRFPVELERAELSAAYRVLAVRNASERARFRGELREAVLRHPGESFFPLLGSLVAMKAGEGDVLSWLGRSVDLSPMNGPAHFVLAQVLKAHGATTQAMLHLRLAAQYDRTLAGPAGVRAAGWAPSVDLLMQAIPDGPFGETMLLEACANQAGVERKVECSRRAALANPRSSRAQQALAEALLAAIQARNSPCNDTPAEQCVAEAARALRVALLVEPSSWRLSYLLSKVFLAGGDAVRASELLTRVCPLTSEGDACSREAVLVAITSRSDSVISAAIAGFVARPCGGSESCAETFDWLAGSLATGEQPALANTFYTKAAEADPSAARWLKLAEHAMLAHLYGVARTALDRADRSSDNSVSSRAHADLLRQKVARAAGSPL